MKGMTDNPDLSKLQSIELEYSACRGDSDSSRTTMKNKPYIYKNTLTMRSSVCVERSNVKISLP